MGTISSGLEETYRAVDFIRDFVATVDFGLFGDYPFNYVVHDDNNTDVIWPNYPQDDLTIVHNATHANITVPAKNVTSLPPNMTDDKVEIKFIVENATVVVND